MAGGKRGYKMGGRGQEQEKKRAGLGALAGMDLRGGWIGVGGSRSLSSLLQNTAGDHLFAGVYLVMVVVFFFFIGRSD